MMERVTAAKLKDALAEHVERSARLMTDESSAYTKAGREYADHQTTTHSKGE